MKVTEILTETVEAAPAFPIPKGYTLCPPTTRKSHTEYEANRKGNKLPAVETFYEKLGWKRTDVLAPGVTMTNWGATVVKMKGTTKGVRLELSFDHHRNLTYIRFISRGTKAE